MEKINVKSFFTRRRKWEKLLQMWSASMGRLRHDITVNVIFLDLTKIGYIKRSEKVTISNVSPETHDVNVTPAHGFLQCICSSQGRVVTLESREPSKSSKRKSNHYSKLFKKERDDKVKTFDKTSNNKSESEEDSDLEENFTDSDDEGPKWVPPLKKVPRKLRSLHFDACIKKRHSKKRSIHSKYFTENVFLVAKTESKFYHHTKKVVTPLYVEENKEVEENGDDYTNSASCGSLTLGDFLTDRDLTRLDLRDLRKEQSSSGIEECGLGYPEVLETRQDPSGDEKINISEIFSSNQDTNNGGLECENEFLSDPVSVVVEDIDSVTSEVYSEHGNHENELRDRNSHLPPVILLSHSVTRPDRLRMDFKLNYKEAKCKPRRFIINVTQLAYQHFVLNNKIPLRIIPQLDLSLYLVFVYVKEAGVNADEYRVSINTNLQFNNHESILASLCQGTIISIHQVMQKVITALDSLDLNQIKKIRNPNQQDVSDFIPLHSFNTLTSACKWNIQIIEHSYSLEWSDNSSSLGYLAHVESDSDKHFTERVTLGDAIFSKEIKGNNVSKQGPHNPSICGICLQDFNKGKFSFPLALCLCSHWFCESCWKASFYLHSNKIEQNSKFMCLEEGCTSPLDSGLLLSLLPLQVVRDYELNRWKNAIENTPRVIMCSNPSCQRIVFAKTQSSKDFEQVINVTCQCHYQTCFSCKSSPHWPINCDVAKIYQRRLSVSQHDKLKQQLNEDEFPDMVLRGKPCPSCEQINQSDFKFSGLKTCACGCVFCWSCGKEINELQNDLHVSCTQQFQTEDKKLKQSLNSQDCSWSKNGEIAKWYKVALRHRQIQHPQIVNILYKMADCVAETVGEISHKGKYVGNARQAAVGWKSHFRKFAEKKLKQLLISQPINQESNLNKSGFTDHVSTLNVEYNQSNTNDFRDTPRSNSSMSSTKSLQMEEQTLSASSLPQTQISKCDPTLRKAIFNIVNIKLELHHIIEHTAVLLEYSHTLNQPGKVIRSLERAEDLCTCLDMLLQPTHPEGSSRVIPSFLRLRTQITNVLTTLQNHLREHSKYHNR